MDWIDLAEGSDHWRALVKLRVPRNLGIFLSGCTTGGFLKRV